MKTNPKKNIADFKKLKILVVGDAILDTYIYGTIDKICREAPVPVFNATHQKFCCGGAANTALNVAALGAETYFLSVLGKDSNAKELYEILHANNIHTEFIVNDKSRKTIAKKRVIASSNIILRLDEGTVSEINESIEKELLKKFFLIADFVDAILISDYGFGVITDTFIRSIEDLKTWFPKPVIVDAKNLSRFKNIHPDAVKPNYQETLQLLNIAKVPINKRAEQVIKNEDLLLTVTGAENIAATLDESGMVLLRKEKKPFLVPCIPKEAKNTIGAGDTFVSALTLGMALNLPIETATEIACAAASIVVQKEDTTLCTNIQLKAYFNDIPKYLSNHEDVVNTIKELKEKGKKIVFTNGCFDLIHKGHIALLNQAREAGDVLIVGVNNDESARKVKGPDRPVNTLEDRIAVLAGLQSIDYLVAFSEVSPIHLLKEVHPNVFVKGADYTETSIPEINLLKKLGCEIKIIPHKQDISTTNIIQRINEIVEEAGRNKDLKKVEILGNENNAFIPQ